MSPACPRTPTPSYSTSPPSTPAPPASPPSTPAANPDPTPPTSTSPPAKPSPTSSSPDPAPTDASASTATPPSTSSPTSTATSPTTPATPPPPTPPDSSTPATASAHPPPPSPPTRHSNSPPPTSPASPPNADAVVLNITAVNARTAGFATIYPCGQPRPDASNLNFTTGQTIPNLVIARPGTNGRVCIYSDTTIDVLADLNGHFPNDSGYTPTTNPTRLLDTRNGIGAPATALAANQTLELPTTNIAGVPANADAVVLNITAVNARTAGFATIYPCGQPRPDASNLNFTTGQTIPNLVIARPGTNGRVCIYSDTTIDVLADLNGHFPNDSGYTPTTNPTRLLDTRNGIGI